jgi:recombination protein RecA
MDYMSTYISTGSVGVDGMLNGGWKRGAIVEIWGGTGTGKTTLAQHAVNDLEPPAEALWITVGTERPHRPVRASITTPKTAEEVFSITSAALMMGADLVVIDSANGLVRSREFEGSPDYEWYYKPSPHREYKVELDLIKDQCEMYGGTVLFLSKPRDKERTPIRGTGVSEKAVQRVNLKVAHAYQDGSSRIEASLKDGSSCEYLIRPGSGIDWSEELLRTGAEHGIVVKRGAWYIMPDRKRVQGTDEAVGYVRANPAIAAYLNREIRRDFQIE